MQTLPDLQQNPVGVVVVLRDQRELEGLRRSAITNARLAAEIEDRLAGRWRQFEAVSDYAVVRDARTLLPVADATRSARGLIAVRLGRVRLIDNMAIS